MRYTLTTSVNYLQEIKHSRFLVHANTINTVDQALEFIRHISAPDATHNCWAYRCGAQYRFNDAGEPAGTAGRPILSAIDGQDYDQVVVVVSRWFGGIKLGAGGLVRAYGGVAAQCLRTAERKPLIPTQQLYLACPFALVSSVYLYLAQYEATKLDEQFNEHGVQLHVECPLPQVEALQTRLRDVSAGKVRWLDSLSS